MSNELMVKYKWQDKDITLTKSDVRNLISTDPNVTDKEIALFMQLCKYQSLNPFIREAYLIKYGNQKAQMVTGIETFTKRMENHKDFNGVVPSNNYETEKDINKWWSEVAVYRKNLEYPIIHRVYYTEYVGTDKQGNITKIWRTKPKTMLDKCSLMGGGRKAFPTALGGLYEEHELDQKEMPKDITPKSKEEDVITEQQAEIIEADMEEMEKTGQLEPKRAETTEVDYDVVEDEPASGKQRDYIYGVGDKKGIVNSHLITKEEIKRIGKPKGLSKEKAGKVLLWWWGDKDKNIIGEREKREKNPKEGVSDLDRRSQLMREVLALMKKNYIHKPMQKKFYKKFQKSDIKELTTEELVTLKGELEHYVPDWK